MAGVTYVSPFFGCLDDIFTAGLGLSAEIRQNFTLSTHLKSMSYQLKFVTLCTLKCVLKLVVMPYPELYLQLLDYLYTFKQI